MKRVETREAFVRGLEELKPHLVLGDYHLPNFDGLSALAITQEKSPDVPFVFISGTIGEESAIEVLKKGATDYVLKNRLSRLVPRSYVGHWMRLRSGSSVRRRRKHSGSRRLSTRISMRARRSPTYLSG